MKKYLYPAIGAAAFIIGGIVTREKALETVGVLENWVSKKKAEPEISDQ